jgi:CCR4-NOT transcriptional regulation complex NOT5 subunit
VDWFERCQKQGTILLVARKQLIETKIEQFKRLVNNDVLDVDSVDPIKDDLEYYSLDSYEDVDDQQAYDEEYFYEALGLEYLAVVNVDRVTQVAVPAKKKLDDDTNTSSSTKDIQRHVAGSKDAARKPTSAAKPFSLGRFLFRDFLKIVKE